MNGEKHKNFTIQSIVTNDSFVATKIATAREIFYNSHARQMFGAEMVKKRGKRN